MYIYHRRIWEISAPPKPNPSWRDAHAQLTLGCDFNVNSRVTIPRISLSRTINLPGNLGSGQVDVSEGALLVGRRFTGQVGGATLQMSVKGGCKWNKPEAGLTPEFQFNVETIEPVQLLAAVAAVGLAPGQRVAVDPRWKWTPPKRLGVRRAEYELRGGVQRVDKCIEARIAETSIVLHV